MGAPLPKRTQFLLRILIVVVLAPLLTIVGLEVYLRATLHPPAAPSRFYFAQPPLAQLRVRIREDLAQLPARNTSFTTNALGLRGDDLDLSDHSALRVLTLGDSVTECMLLSDEDAWPHRLQEELAGKLGRPVWVGNAARSGEMISDYAAHMRLLVPQIAPDLIVIVAGGHDFQAALEEALFPVSFDNPERLKAFATKLYVQPNLNGIEASYLGFMWERWGHPEELDMTDFYKRMRQRRTAHPKLADLPDLTDALDVYAANLDSLVAGFRDQPKGTQMVLATHPYLWRADLSAHALETLWAGYTCLDCSDPTYYEHAALATGMRRWNETLLHTCEKHDLPCLDLDRVIDKKLGNFYDDAHMGELGARQAARAIAEFVVRRKLLP